MRKARLGLQGIEREAERLRTLIGMPSGAIVLWDNSDSCPTGFTRVSGADNRYLYAVAAGAGGTGGNATHNHDLTTTNYGSTSPQNSILIDASFFKTWTAGAATKPFPHPTTDSQNNDPLLYKVLV
jgi:hypothetical protein